MSVGQLTDDNVITGTTPKLQRTTNLPTPANFTYMVWACHTNGFVNDYQDIFGLSDTNNVIGLGLYNNVAGIPGSTDYYFNIGDLNSDVPGNRIIPDNQWNHYCLSIEDVPGTGTRAIGYLNGCEHVRGSLINAFPPTFMSNFNSRASDTDTGAVWTGNMCGLKIWEDRALTPEQIRKEMWCYMPVIRDGLWACSPWIDVNARTDNYGIAGAWSTQSVYFTTGSSDPAGVVWDQAEPRSLTQIRRFILGTH
jgi:Concanavalin A-like lectin/glucanases superfamily